MPSIISRVFKNGNSQAVRIPQEFRLNTSRIEITQDGDGNLVLHPIPSPSDPGQALLAALEAFDAADVACFSAERVDQPPLQDREPL